MNFLSLNGCNKRQLDPCMMPGPMSLDRSGLIDSIFLIKDEAFLGTSAHESLPLVGYLLATWAFPLCVATEKPFAKR